LSRSAYQRDTNKLRLLVAGIGNVFFGDDGFGPEVARILATDPIEGVTIEDYGIRSLHLAYELLAGYDRAFIIDAVPRGGLPGTLYVLEPKISDADIVPDAHRMDLASVFGLVRMIGREPPPITIVGCEPSGAQETLELTEPVRCAVQPAVDLVRKLVEDTFANVKDERNTVWTGA
jgi:hydrogenase maturation protease